MQTIGVKIQVDGGKQFQTELAQINAKSKELASELKAVTSSLDNTGSKSAAAAQKMKVLEQSVQNQEKYIAKLSEKYKSQEANLEQLKAQLEKAKAEYGENSTEVQRLNTAIQRQETELSKTGTAINRATADLNEMRSALAEAQSEANPSRWERLSASLQRVSDKADMVAKKTKAISTAAAAGLTGLVGNAVAAGKSADNINTLAKQYGVTTAEIQKMNYAQDLIDVSTQDMLGSMAKLTKNMTSSAKDTVAAFEKLGVATTDANGEARDSTTVWYETLEALSKVTNETERDQLAMQIFGKSANELAGVIDDGGAALKEMGKQAEDLGLILDQDALDNANKFNDAIDRLKGTGKQAFLKAGAALSKSLIPALEKIAKVAGKAFEKFGNLSGGTQKLILGVLGLVAAISPVASIISKVTKATKLLKVGMTVLNPTFLLVAAGIAAVIAAGVLIVKNWDKIKEAGKKLATDVKAKFTEIKNNIVNTWNSSKTAVTTAVTNIRTAVTNAFTNLKNSVTTIWNNIRAGITTAIENAKSTVSAKVDEIKSKVSTAWGNLSGTVRGVFDGIKGAITSPIESAKNTISNLVEKIKGFFNFKIDLSKIFTHITLPHIRAITKYIGPVSIPWFEIDWYKKAAKMGAMFNSPQIIGVGDANQAEVLLGENTLRSMIREAAASAGNRGGAGRPVEVNVYASQGMNETQLADLVARRIQREVMNRRAVWA